MHHQSSPPPKKKHMLVATNIIMSRQAYFCRDKHMFVATKHIFRRDKNMLVAAATNDTKTASSSRRAISLSPTDARILQNVSVVQREWFVGELDTVISWRTGCVDSATQLHLVCTIRSRAFVFTDNIPSTRITDTCAPHYSLSLIFDTHLTKRESR